MNNEPLTLQVHALKQITVAEGEDKPKRFRLELTDGANVLSGMLATQLNVLIENGSIKEGSIITITQYMVNEAVNQKIIVIMAMTVVSTDAKPLMGGTSLPIAPGAAITPAPAPVAAAPQNMPPAAAPIGSGAVPTFGYGGSYGNSANTNSKPVIASGAHHNTIPITALNPYSNKWAIKARITSKADKRSWSNANGQGTLFSIDLLDSDKGEIRATFFKETCEKFYPLLREGSVYVFSGGKLKPVGNRAYSTLNNNYEITFDMNSTIEEVADEGNIVTMNYNFVGIDTIENTDPGVTVDLCAYVNDASDVQEIISQKQGGKVLKKRDLTIMDQSGAEIKLTLWGDKAESAEYPWHDKPICAFKGIKVGDYGGRSLSMMGSSNLAVAPQIPQAMELKGWLEQQIQNGGTVQATSSLSSSVGGGGGARDTFESRKPCSAIKDDSMGVGKEKPDWASMKLSVVYIKHDNDPWYTACSQKDCKKKVIEGLQGGWRCEKCQVDMESCVRRYILTTQLCDASGANWFSFFDEQAKVLLGTSADELYELRQNQGDEAYNQVFSEALFNQYIIKARVKEELVQEELRVKCVVNDLSKINYVKECSDMIDAINKYQ